MVFFSKKGRKKESERERKERKERKKGRKEERERERKKEREKKGLGNTELCLKINEDSFVIWKSKPGMSVSK